MNDLLSPLHECLAATAVRAWRLHLDTPGVYATVPLLRGVWGAALHRLDPALYAVLFEGGATATPRYLMRPAPADAQPAPALELVLFGEPDAAVERVVWAAWEGALRTGLGPRRQAADLVAVRPLAWDGTALAPARVQPGFRLHPLPWPAGDPEAPCRLVFAAPLRLLRQGHLIQQPTLPDLTIAALRRLQALAPAASVALWASRSAWLDEAQRIPAADWRGAPLDLVRYSGRQKSEVELRGVAGELYLPRGAGLLADLLAAAAWLHLGKGTVMGLGQLVVAPGAPTA
jgi:hypothetical protein